jgi:hypothetical protein
VRVRKVAMHEALKHPSLPWSGSSVSVFRLRFRTRHPYIRQQALRRATRCR